MAEFLRMFRLLLQLVCGALHLLEPMVGEDGPEEVEALLHPVLCVVLLQHLIIFTGCS